jgi:hypothetical protein
MPDRDELRVLAIEFGVRVFRFAYVFARGIDKPDIAGCELAKEGGAWLRS